MKIRCKLGGTNKISPFRRGCPQPSLFIGPNTEHFFSGSCEPAIETPSARYPATAETGNRGSFAVQGFSPSMKIRCQISRFSSRQIRLPWSRRRARCSVNKCWIASVLNKPRSRLRESSNLRSTSSSVSPRQPLSPRRRESHLRSIDNRLGRRSFAADVKMDFPLNPLMAYLAGHRGGELYQLMIEKRHATLDGCSHGHLVLLHGATRPDKS